jgi:FkbM family methyltransferase
VWRIEKGAGAGLKIRYPQNHEFVLGTNERPVQAVVSTFLQPGAAFYDVGANVGFFSLIAARRTGATGKVYAFEPVTENAQVLRCNATLNDCDRIITCFELAIARTCRHEDLLMTQWDGGAMLATSVGTSQACITKRRVRVVNLDYFIEAEHLRVPAFVKIDVEGAELDVVRGMSRTMAKSRPFVLYEIDDSDRESFHARWQEVDQYVAEHDYEIIHLENSYPDLKWNVGHSFAIPRS